MRTPIDVILAVVGLGGRLGVAGDKLRMVLPADCPPKLKEAIRQHKPALLKALQLDFLVVRFDALNTIVFWTKDEATKESLAAAGADPGVIYSAPELEKLVRRRVTLEDLRVLHAAKQRFSGKVADP